MIERQRLIRAAQTAMDNQTGALDAKADPVVDAVLDGLIDIYRENWGGEQGLRWLYDLRDGRR